MKDEELDQIIGKSFKAEPEYFLPPDFANKVTNIISLRKESMSIRHEYYSLAAFLILLLAAASGITYLFDREAWQKSLSCITNNAFQFVFIFIILSFILFADKVLLRFLFSRRNR